MAWLFLFLFGLAAGSFLNVLALRYDGERWNASGRSHCPHCKRTLQWFELIPLFSFLAQRGKCRSCAARISLRYPAVELVSAAIFVFVPLHFVPGSFALSVLWVLAFELLLLITYVDLRLYIIPDELTVLLGAVAIFTAVFAEPDGNIWLGRLAGALAGVVFFGALALATRGKGMGMGDVKLAAPLGFLFGWPNIVFLCGAAFVIGALAGVVLLSMKQKTMGSAVPFAPFLALGAAFVFFFGAPILGWYFHIIGL